MKKAIKTALVSIVIIALALSLASAATFYFNWIETPFDPTNYHWQELWEVKEMVDFMEATLTITGCAYQGQSHNINLEIKNVATVSNYYALSFDYFATWYVDEENQEPIISGVYSGALGVGESIIDTVIDWQPSVIGAGFVKMNIIDIKWHQGEPITWITEVIDNTGGVIEVSDFEVSCILSGLTGTVSFGLRNTNEDGTWLTDYKVEIVELSQIIAEVTGIELIGGKSATPFSHDFIADTGGILTMQITVTA